MVRALFLSALAATASARLLIKNRETGHPIEKVISMLKNLELTARSELAQSEEGFAKFQQWCRDTANETNYQVGQDQKKVDGLKLELEDLNAQTDMLDAEIKKNKEQKAKLEKKVEMDLEKRKFDRAAFEKEHKKWTDARKACQQAVVAIKAKAGEMKDADLDGMTIASFLQEETALQAFQQQAPAAFQFSSAKVVETLRNLANTFNKNGEECYKTEEGKKTAMEMRIGKNKQTIGVLTETLAENETRMGELVDATNTAQLAHDNLEEDCKKNIAFLSDLEDQCGKKTTKFSENTKTQEEEVTALVAAIGALSQGMDTFVKPSLMQTEYTSEDARVEAMRKQAESDAGMSSFLQMKSHTHRVKNFKLVQFLQKQGQALHSVALLSLALKAGDDPFVKVRSLISDMIEKLEEQGAEEMDQAAFCKEEEGNAIKEKDEAEVSLEESNAEISKLDKTISESKKTMAQKAQEIESAELMLKNGEEQWQKETDQKKESLENAKGAKDAVDSALETLRGFYKPAMFLQQQPKGVTTNADGVAISQSQGDAAFEPARKNQSSSGVLALLNQIAEDYDKEIKDTTAYLEEIGSDWETAEGKLNDLIAAAKDTKQMAEETKETSISDKDTATDKQKTSTDIVAKKTAFMETLKKTCADTGMSFKERKAARQKEVKALKDALKILQEISGSP